MREIKFRAFNEKSKKFHYWGFLKDGYFVGPKNLFGINEQFTGLLDKNGTEIYEGDILGDGFYKASVVFKNSKFGIEGTRKYIFGLVSRIRHNYKVIGNIHENPELLGVRDEN